MFYFQNVEEYSVTLINQDYCLYYRFGVADLSYKTANYFLLINLAPSPNILVIRGLVSGTRPDGYFFFLLDISYTSLSGS